MHLDLTTLRVRHPRLPSTTAEEYIHRASLGLQRAGHETGCHIDLRFNAPPSTPGLSGSVTWPSADPNHLELLDQHRITEDSAEAISLVLVHQRGHWSILRRLQRYESADWLLARFWEGRPETMALEVSGMAEGVPELRLREKLEQASLCCVGDKKAAAVVVLAMPLAIFHTLERSDDESG